MPILSPLAVVDGLDFSKTYTWKLNGVPFDFSGYSGAWEIKQGESVLMSGVLALTSAGGMTTTIPAESTGILRPLTIQRGFTLLGVTYVATVTNGANTITFQAAVQFIRDKSGDVPYAGPAETESGAGLIATIRDVVEEVLDDFPPSGGVWGQITGNLADQEDLAAALASEGGGGGVWEFEVAEAAFEVSDAVGTVAFEVGSNGVTRAASLTADTLSFGEMSVGDVVLETVDQWHLAVYDEEGNVVFGVEQDGTVVAKGIQAGIAPGEITHSIQHVFAEPYEDASRALLVTWCTTSADADIIRMTLRGSGVVVTGQSHRSRPFPANVTGRYLHTALFDDLSPGGVYDLSWPGTLQVDSLRVPPRAGVKVALASDWQRTNAADYLSTGLLAQFGELAGDQACDLVIFNGDFVNDDGRFDEVYGLRWMDFLNAMWTYWRRDGHIIPIAATMGNHEARNAAGNSNATSGGTGTPGPMLQIYSLGYDADLPGYYGRSAFSFTVGRELAVVTIETDHTVPLASQVPWLETELDRLIPEVRHAIVVGHSPAFFAYWDTWESINTQARALKSQVWPVMQEHASKIRAYVCGHEHRLTATARLKFGPGPWSPLSEVDDAWTTASDGIRQIGSGMLGGTHDEFLAGLVDQVSSIDGSPKFLGAVGAPASNAAAMVTYGSLFSTAAAADLFNMWVASFTSSSFTATALSRNGGVFGTITESI